MSRNESGSSASSLYDQVTSRIIAELEAGRLPWVQPWAKAGVSAGLPRNAGTGRSYSGINVLILWAAVMEHGYDRQAWITYRQAEALGGHVRKGEAGTTVCYADRFTPKAEQERAASVGDEARQIAFLKRFTVFNVDQCEGLPVTLPGIVAPLPEREIIPHAEALIDATGADFRIGGDRAFYAPAADFVQVPFQQLYWVPIDWYRTAFHELGHNAAIRIMPHDLCGRLVFRALAMRLFGIIRALPGTRGVDRRAGTGPAAWLGRRRERALFPSSACRHGCRFGWSRHPRDQARARSPLDRYRGAAGPSPCCGEAYAA